MPTLPSVSFPLFFLFLDSHSLSLFFCAVDVLAELKPSGLYTAYCIMYWHTNNSQDLKILRYLIGRPLIMQPSPFIESTQAATVIARAFILRRRLRTVHRDACTDVV